MDALSNLPPLIDKLGLDYENLRSEIAAALSAVPDLNIDSDQDILAARELVAPLKALQGQVDAAFRQEKAPWLAGGRTCDQFFKALRVSLDATVATITADVSAYQARKLAAARAEAAFLDEAPPKPAAAARVSDEGRAVISGAIRWTFEIVDIDAVPRELMQINTAAVSARISGLKASGADITKAAEAIPGVRVFERVSTVFRK